MAGWSLWERDRVVSSADWLTGAMVMHDDGAMQWCNGYVWGHNDCCAIAGGSPWGLCSGGRQLLQVPYQYHVCIRRGGWSKSRQMRTEQSTHLSDGFILVDAEKFAYTIRHPILLAKFWTRTLMTNNMQLFVSMHASLLTRNNSPKGKERTPSSSTPVTNTATG